jgi:hypothetical protein
VICSDPALVYRLCEKFPKAEKSVKSSERAFDALDTTADPNLVSVWKEQEAAALLGRNMHPESMDIYDIKIQKGLSGQNPLFAVANCTQGPSKDEMQLQLMNDERTNAGTKGSATLIGQGLKIEDSQ